MQAWTHPACLAHDTGPGHAERPERLRAVLDALHAAWPGMHSSPPRSKSWCWIVVSSEAIASPCGPGNGVASNTPIAELASSTVP